MRNPSLQEIIDAEMLARARELFATQLPRHPPSGGAHGPIADHIQTVCIVV